MRLYLISQSENNNYDTYDSAVVAAEDEESARTTLPGSYVKWGDKYSCWASSPEKVSVEFIGEAVEGTVAGVILASFNAG